MILDRTAWLAWLMYWTPLLRRGLQSDREPQGQAIPVKRRAVPGDLAVTNHDLDGSGVVFSSARRIRC
jgi:hypothetical protein